jgi:rhodanese-related sulfurtransferase
MIAACARCLWSWALGIETRGRAAAKPIDKLRPNRLRRVYVPPPGRTSLPDLHPGVLLRKPGNPRASHGRKRPCAEQEWAVHIPLPELTCRLDELPPGVVWVHCGSGYRAAAATSLLTCAGRHVVHIDAVDAATLRHLLATDTSHS